MVYSFFFKDNKAALENSYKYDEFASTNKYAEDKKAI